MKKLILAWRVSATWMRITAIVVLLLIIKAGFDLTSPAPPSAAPLVAASVASAASVDRVAIASCRRTVISVAKNKSSVEFHGFGFPPQVKKMPGIGFEVVLKFSAKNAFGSRSTSLARCITSEDGLTVTSFAAVDSR